MSKAPVSQLKRDTSPLVNFSKAPVSQLKRDTSPLVNFSKATSLRLESESSGFSDINYDMWVDVYSRYLKEMYSILRKFTRIKSEDTSFTRVQKSKQLVSTKAESISFDSFCKFIYTHSSRY